MMVVWLDYEKGDSYHKELQKRMKMIENMCQLLL